MKYIPALLLLLTAYYTAYGQSDQWISWETYNNVEDVAYDCDYTWIATSSAIIAYDNNTGEEDYFSEGNSGIKGYITEIEIDRDGNKWITSTEGLFMLKNNIITKIESDLIDTALVYSFFLNDLKIDAAGNLWFNNHHNNIYKYNTITNKGAVFTLPESISVLQLEINDVGNVYALGIDKTLGYYIYMLNENITQIASFEQLPFKSEFSTSFVIDSENNFWIVNPATVTFGKEELEILKGGIIIFDNKDWHTFDVEKIQTNEDVVGYQSAFKLKTGGIILQDHTAYLWIETNQTYFAHFNRFTKNIDFELFSDTIMLSSIVGVDLENNIYFQKWDLIKLNPLGLQTSITLTQLPQNVFSNIFAGNNNAFWIYDFDKLRMFHQDQYTNYDDKINTYTDTRLINVLCDSIYTWFIFEDLVVKFDGVNWQYYSLKAFGLDGYLNYIEHAQIDKQNNLWVLGNNLLLKQNGISWDVMYAFNNGEHYFYDFTISDSIAYVIGKERLFVYDQNVWQSKLWGDDDLPAMDGNIKSIAAENGNIFISNYDTIYHCSGLDVNLFLDVKTNVFTYNQNAQIFSWIVEDSLYQLDNLNVLSKRQIICNNNYQSMCADGLGNLFLGASYSDPYLMFNPEGVVGYSAPILKTEDIPLANCGVYINEMHNLEIKVFPNPSTNYIDVYWNMVNSGDINISIYDITGKLMLENYKSSVEAGVILLNYDVSYYTSGVYFIHVDANNQTSTIPFIRL